MNHREFLKTLSSAQKEHLSLRSDREGLVQLGIHLSCLLLNSLLIVFLPVGSAVHIIVLSTLVMSQGIMLVFLFTLMHETTHRTPFESIKLNRLAGWFCGFVLFLPAEWFRHFHLAHHRYTHEPGNDPELDSPKPNSPGSYLLYLSGLPVWKSHIGTLFRNAAGNCTDVFVSTGRHRIIALESRLMLAAYVCVFVAAFIFAPQQILLLWLVPLAVGQPFLRAYLLAEHAHCEHVPDMFRNTRTTLTSRLIYRLAWNMPFHAEHHAFPAVPFYRLPELHQLVGSHLKVKQKGFWRFNRDFLDVQKNHASGDSTT